jgi:hypothetical protein
VRWSRAMVVGAKVEKGADEEVGFVGCTSM